MALAEVRDDLSRFLRLAASEEMVITLHGRPAGLPIGFETEEDWFDYPMEHQPAFWGRVAEARKALEEGTGDPTGELSGLAQGGTLRSRGPVTVT